MTFGDFYVVKGYSLEGGLLCPEKCGPCKGGVTELTLRYDGFASAEVIVGKKMMRMLYSTAWSIPVRPSVLATMAAVINCRISRFMSMVRKTPPSIPAVLKPVGPGIVFGDFTVVEGLQQGGCSSVRKKTSPVRWKRSRWRLKDEKLKWEIENTGTGTVTIETIDITWPAGAGGLKKIKFDGDIFKPKKPAPPTNFFIDSGWKGDEKDRQLKKGDKEKLEFEFEEDIPAGEIFVTVKFAEGDDCVLELYIPDTTGGDFECDKPLDALTMIWTGQFGYPKMSG